MTTQPTFTEKLDKAIDDATIALTAYSDTTPDGRIVKVTSYDEVVINRHKLIPAIKDLIEQTRPAYRSKLSREYQLWPDVVNGHTEALDEWSAALELGDGR